MHTAGALPGTPHYRVYFHLSLTVPAPPYYLLDFRPGTADPEPEITDTDSESLPYTTSSIPWGRVYALPLSSYNPAIWNSTITDGLSELDILVLMRTLEVINEYTTGGVRWVMKGKREEAGAFKITLEKAEVKAPISTPGSSGRGATTPMEEVARKEGLFTYLLVVPQREEYTLRRKEQNDGGIEPVMMTGEPISNSSTSCKQEGTSFDKRRLALPNGILGILVVTAGAIVALYMAAGYVQVPVISG